MFRRLTTLAGPLIAVALLCPAAVAGPMSWSFRAVVEAGNGGSVPPASAVLSLGQFQFTDTPAPTSLSAAEPGTAFGWAPLPTGSTGEMDGSGTIVLAAASKGVFQTGSSLPAASVDSFRTLLEITDGESGVRGYTYMNGTGGLVGASDRGELQLSGEGRVLIDLGNHRYDITWHRQESESVSRIVADVNITGRGGNGGDSGGGNDTGGGPTTPEPATLALAGLGLGVVGLRRLRRM